MGDQLRERVVGVIGDTYEVEAEIGRGGMAVVYRARDLKLRRLVAIKVLPPDLAFREEVRTRFLREAQTAAQLNHPNIVPIFSVDERGGLVYFVMARWRERVSGTGCHASDAPRSPTWYASCARSLTR
jgi:eukaryotic-like serine/threonine-protein kinase